jgi:hypothetical protein
MASNLSARLLLTNGTAFEPTVRLVDMPGEAALGSVAFSVPFSMLTDGAEIALQIDYDGGDGTRERMDARLVPIDGASTWALRHRETYSSPT